MMEGWSVLMKRRQEMRKTFVLFAMVVLTGLATTINEAWGQFDGIAILGPPEEPRFSEMKDD
jgi:hypothetical protein